MPLAVAAILYDVVPATSTVMLSSDASNPASNSPSAFVSVAVAPTTRRQAAYAMTFGSTLLRCMRSVRRPPATIRSTIEPGRFSFARTFAQPCAVLVLLLLRVRGRVPSPLGRVLQLIRRTSTLSTAETNDSRAWKSVVIPSAAFVVNLAIATPVSKSSSRM